MRSAGGEKIHTTRLRIGQNCRAVCTIKSGLALATEPLAKREARSILFSSPVAMFEQSENVAVAHVHLVAMRGVASATISICACARY